MKCHWNPGAVSFYWSGHGSYLPHVKSAPVLNSAPTDRFCRGWGCGRRAASHLSPKSLTSRPQSCGWAWPHRPGSWDRCGNTRFPGRQWYDICVPFTDKAPVAAIVRLDRSGREFRLLTAHIRYDSRPIGKYTHPSLSGQHNRLCMNLALETKEGRYSKFQKAPLNIQITIEIKRRECT